MPRELLSIGRPILMTQNVVYALPARRCFMMCDTSTATFEQSNSETMVPAVALTPNADEQNDVGGAFIRCTSGNVLITLKNT